MFGSWTIKGVIGAFGLGILIGAGLCAWWGHIPAPAPLTEPERAALEESGHTKGRGGDGRRPDAGTAGDPGRDRLRHHGAALEGITLSIGRFLNRGRCFLLERF